MFLLRGEATARLIKAGGINLMTHDIKVHFLSLKVVIKYNGYCCDKLLEILLV